MALPGSEMQETEQLLEDFLDAKSDDETEKPEEQLHDVRRQYWALGLGMLALPLAAFGLHVPMSCVHFGADATMPEKCEGEHYIGLRLPDFCWRPCQIDLRKMIMMGLLACGLLMQAYVVLLSTGGCHNWCHLSWYFDPSDLMEKMDGKGGGRESKDSWLSTFNPVRNIKRRAQSMALGKLSNLAHNSVQHLDSTRAAAVGSRACLLCGFVQLGIIAMADYSDNVVTFDCPGIEGVTAKPEKKPYLMFFLGASLVLLLFSLALQQKADWIISVRVTPKSARELKGQFSQKGNDYYAWPRFMENNHTGDEITRYADLQVVSLMKLVGMKYRGINRKVSEIGAVPQEAGEEVVLFFKKVKVLKKFTDIENEHRKFAMAHMALAALLLHTASTSCWTCVAGIQIGEDDDIPPLQLDKWLMLMGACGRHADIGQRCFFGSLLLGVALAAQLVIFKCSEHQLEGEEEDILRKDASKIPLFLPIIDFRQRSVLSAKKYLEAGIENLPTVHCYVWVAPTDDEESKDEGVSRTMTKMRGQEVPMDCQLAVEQEQQEVPSTAGTEDKCDEKATKAPVQSFMDSVLHGKLPGGTKSSIDLPEVWRRQPPRVKWQRSSRAWKVQLHRMGDIELQKQWAQGLGREEFSSPAVCIEFEEDGRKVQQIVPPEFVAGHFHAYLNLGPKRTWELLSGALAFCGALVAMYDVLAYEFALGGKILSACHDVMNVDRCLYIGLDPLTTSDSNSPVLFRHSVGAFVAMLGGVLAVMGVTGLRVAKDDSRPPCFWSSDRGAFACCKCMWAYLTALLFSVAVAFLAVKVICISLYHSLRDIIVPACCPLKRLDEDEDQRGEPLLPVASDSASGGQDVRV